MCLIIKLLTSNYLIIKENTLIAKLGAVDLISDV